MDDERAGFLCNVRWPARLSSHVVRGRWMRSMPEGGAILLRNHRATADRSLVPDSLRLASRRNILLSRV